MTNFEIVSKKNNFISLSKFEFFDLHKININKKVHHQLNILYHVNNILNGDLIFPKATDN